MHNVSLPEQTRGDKYYQYISRIFDALDLHTNKEYF